MKKDDVGEKKDDNEKIGYVEFLRSTGKSDVTNETLANTTSQNSNNSPMKREHIGTTSKSKSLSKIKLKTNERQMKPSKSEICNDTPCTIYEAISTPPYSSVKKQECVVSELIGPPTISALPSILRPSKRWHKKSYYSLDSSPEILNDTKTTMHADLLRMPTICSPLVGPTTEAKNHIKRANIQPNNPENNSKSKQ